MSVNGTEIKVGQVWRCADRRLRAVLRPHFSRANKWVLSGGTVVDENGRNIHNTLAQKTPQVLVSLEHQGTQFRQHMGDENPAPGCAVAVYFHRGAVEVGPSELFDWSTLSGRRPACYYSVEQRVNTEPVAKAAPWYPDDSGKWVEVTPGVGNLPDGLHPETEVLTLSGGERTRQHLWDTALPAHRFNWSVIVAYKVVEPAVEQNAEINPPQTPDQSIPVNPSTGEPYFVVSDTGWPIGANASEQNAEINQPQAPGVTAPQLLEKAASHMRDRAATYDRPEGERSMAKTVAAFNAITGRDLTETEGWLLLQVLKDVRLFQRPGYHADSAEDCIAYSALKAESKSKEV